MCGGSAYLINIVWLCVVCCFSVCVYTDIIVSCTPSTGSIVTSCGLPIATLKTSVAYCCGTFLVLVVPATVAKKSKSLLAPVTSAGKKGK